MANSIWDVVYGEDRFKGLLGQEGVHATGGGTVYDPTTDYKETRYDDQGNSYLSNPDAPLIPGHTRAGDTPMFESTKVELPPVQSPHDYGSNYYSDEPWTPKVTRPNVQSATIDSLLAQQGVNQVTQQEQDQFNRINASQNRETRYDDQGNPYQVRRDLPLIPGHTRSLEPQSVEPKVDPMSLYNRQGRADYTPQNIVSDDVVMGEPPLGYYPNASERAEAEESWYQEQDKIEAQIQELLKGTALEQQSLEAEDDKLLQQFQQDDFNQRVQDRLSQPTPDWLGQSQGALTDAQREDLNRYTDTDSFGNPLDTDAFGNTNYETNLNRQLDSMNRMAFSGGNTQEQVPTPQQASNTTDFFRDRAQASKRYQDAILNIGDTIGEGVSSLYEGAKDLGSNIDLGGVGESISNVWGDLTKKDDRSFVERMSDTEQNITQPLREGITDTASNIYDLMQRGEDVAYRGVKGAFDETIKPLAQDWYNRVTREAEKDVKAYDQGKDVGGLMSQNIGKNMAEIVKGTVDAVASPVETADAIASVFSGALQHALPDEMSWNEESKQMASALGQIYAERYGSLEGFKKALAEQPADVIAEVTGVGLLTKLGATKLASKLNDPEFLDKIDELSRQLPETQMSGSFGRSEMVGGDYKGTHTAPQPEGKNSLDDFSEIFPDNANDPNFARYYGMGGEYAKADAETIAVMKAVQGNPDAEVTIYRAVPKGTKDINAGDWVSTSKDYTKKHGERYIDGDYDIIEKKVRAGDLHTDGDLHEWGYNPSRTDDGVLGQVGKTTKDTVDTLEQQAKKYKTSEDWLRAGGADIDLLDEMAFGFSEKSLKTLSPKDLNIKWKDDMLNVEQAIRKSGKTETEWAKSVNLEEPIDVVFENGKFYVDDGHHRYKASKILNKDLNINLEIKDKPIAKITGTKNYNYDDFVRGLWNKFNSKADDGVLGQIKPQYHGTKEEYIDYGFGKNNTDPGWHFGSRDSAVSRLESIDIEERINPDTGKRWRDLPENPVDSPKGHKIIKNELNIKNPLRVYELEDVDSGIWDAKTITKNVLERGELPKGFTQADKKAWRDGTLSATVGKKTVELKNIDTLDIEQQTEWIDNFLTDRGYDGLVYENAFEKGGDSYAVFNKDKIKQLGAERYSALAIPTGGLLGMGESEETQADETEGLLKLNKTADKPMKGVLDGVKGLPKEIMEIRSVRNNNPGNIKLNSANDWDGQTNTGSKDTFAHFKTPEHGVRALVKVINANLRATNSYEAFVNRYASEPNERAYYKKHGKLKPHLQNYAKILSKSQGAKDIKSNPKNVDMLKWVKAIIKAEGGQETLQYFTDDIIRKGMKMATKSK